MAVNFDELLRSSRLVVLVGEGGVGKTSTAAAIALDAARRGRRTAVLTVDPAPRLGQALGLDALDATPRTVAVPGADGGSGSLVAMRLDTRRTFDRMVKRFALSEEAADALLENRIYQAVAGSLGGSEHYMTFQRLYELVTEEDYDLVVVDTPPAAHVAELLGTPAKLADLIDTGAPSVLADPARILARTGSRLATATARLIIAVIERVTGLALRRQISEFMKGFEAVLGGLRDRTGEIESMLRSEATAFCLTVRPRPASVAAARAFSTALSDSGVALKAVIINRLTAARGPERSRPRSNRLEGAPEGTSLAVATAEAHMDSLRQAEGRTVARLTEDLASEDGGESPCLAPVLSLEHDVSSLDDLLEIARELTAGN